MSDPQREALIEAAATEEQDEIATFDCYGLAANLEPQVGLLLELAGDSTWLSWEETQKFVAFLRPALPSREETPHE